MARSDPLLGGFTTFSTFTFETFQLVRDGEYARGFLNARAEVILYRGPEKPRS